MKKHVFLIVVWALMLPSALPACDICGCGAGNYYLGIMPQFHKNFAGVRYRFSSFRSHIGMSAALATQEYFQTTELWGRYYPHPRLQILAFVPYSFNRQVESSVTRYLQGLNDAVLMGNFNVLKTPDDTIPRTLKHNIWVGGGLKLPTGKHTYTETDQTQVANPNFQLGTGSLDFLLNLAYTVRHKRVGLNADLTCKINTTNKDQYRFGNRVTSNIALFYVQKIKKVGIMPHMGVYIENSMQDFRQKEVVIDTGGYFVAQTIGAEVYYKRFSIGGNYQIPLTQNLANGHIQANSRGLVHVSFML